MLQAVEAAQVSPDTVRRWIAAGRLPRHAAGRTLRVKREDLERFLAEVPEGGLTADEAVERAMGKSHLTGCK